MQFMAPHPQLITTDVTDVYPITNKKPVSPPQLCSGAGFTLISMALYFP